MDLMDILITMVIIAIVLGKELLKVKKKLASVAEKQAQETTRLGDGDEIWKTVSYEREGMSENEKFESDSSKSESYFTYEDVSDSETSDLASGRPSPSRTREIHLQEVENETETSEINFDDPEELKKAIIYSEILKKPYN